MFYYISNSLLAKKFISFANYQKKKKKDNVSRAHKPQQNCYQYFIDIIIQNKINVRYFNFTFIFIKPKKKKKNCFLWCIWED
jgi:hypothetical protein